MPTCLGFTYVLECYRIMKGLRDPILHLCPILSEIDVYEMESSNGNSEVSNRDGNQLICKLLGGSAW